MERVENKRNVEDIKGTLFDIDMNLYCVKTNEELLGEVGLAETAFILQKALLICQKGETVWVTPFDMDSEEYIPDLDWSHPYPFVVEDISIEYEDETKEYIFLFHLHGELCDLAILDIDVVDWVYLTEEDALRDMEEYKKVYQMAEMNSKC